MPDLKLLLLGSPRIEHHDDELKVETRKTIALAAYLAVTGTAQRREHLATLLWPESDQARARASLRYTLSALKRAIGGAYLETDRETIALVGDDDLWIDVERFRSRLAECHTHGHAHTEVCPECVAPLTAAAALYRDDFLTGFTLPDSATFDEWQFFETESLRRDMMDALERLVRAHADTAEYDTAIEYARRLVSLDFLHEPAHRALMRLYAQVDRRSAALWQYQECVRILNDELGVEPAAETTRLYEQIQTGVLPATESQRPLFPGTTVPSAQLPAFLESDAAHPAREDDVFVGREPQLAALETHLAAALEGQGLVVFVTGEAGQGKTALLTAFARRAQEKHPDLLVASGAGTAHFGVGGPYLPFCDVLDMLTGDVERPRTVGRLTPEQVQRLGRFAPQAIEAIATVGADLIDVLIPGDVLTQRAAAMAPDADLWVQHVHDRMTRATGRLDAVQQHQLSEQYVRVLDTLAKRQPLLLLLDDLQWADSASVNLLFHLGRRVPGRRLLIVGSYRPSDLTLEDADAGHASAGTSKHPLQPVVHELTRQFGNIRIDLDELPRREERQFVDALVDSRPNGLDEVFREQLFRRTKGHALFTVELLREMQARGDLVQDDEGRWSAARDLAWDVLPARIEAVIAERISRLDDDLQEMLRTASVEGETFTVQVMAQVLQVDERQVLRQLFQHVAQHHQLVHEAGAVNVGQRRLIQYKFNHSMFKQYLYNSLSPGERRLLHREIAGSLAGLYADRSNDITVQLAHHYTQADEAEQAVPYLLQAGDTARNVYAHQEAIDHYRRALAFLKEQQTYDRAARILMKIGLTYHTAFQFERAQEAYEEGFFLWQHAGTRRTADLSPAPHALRIPWTEVATIDPTLTWDSFSGEVIEQLFSGLLAHDPEMGVVPDIARRWDVLDGGRTYVFHLRDDVQWSDGTPVTAGDFEYAFKSIY